MTSRCKLVTSVESSGNNNCNCFTACPRGLLSSRSQLDRSRAGPFSLPSLSAPFSPPGHTLPETRSSSSFPGVFSLGSLPPISDHSSPREDLTQVTVPCLSLPCTSAKGTRLGRGTTGSTSPPPRCLADAGWGFLGARECERRASGLRLAALRLCGQKKPAQ